ncbi:alpha-ketoglutarate-dependent dioxygenase AlkB family protein [Glaciecola sp. 1036]|uniref:alpha-ketoglutarate-dependent dioxygenase AlkB family protein n=1 Tax=Alteromonadaceae TaxID=72275 RepID=UPI003D04434D
MQTSFVFDQDTKFERLKLNDADLIYSRKWLPYDAAWEYFETLHKELPWSRDNIVLFGKTRKIPRLQSWHGEHNASYMYSGIKMLPKPWTPALLALKAKCEQVCNTEFNSVLANLYRDGMDSMGFHSDDEKELGKYPIIASVSLGQSRNLDFVHKINQQKHRVELHHGSLLIMRGSTQEYWNHGINKTKQVASPRINLTFRQIIL